MNEADLVDPPPLLTLLDLWYTAHGERGVYFTWESLEDMLFDDWLMQNMALVANRVIRSKKAKGAGVQVVEHVAPYGLSVYLDRRTHKVRVVVFMENRDGNCREQGVAYTHTQP